MKSKTEQTVDGWGNISQSKQYDFVADSGSFGAVSRTYDYTYLMGPYYNPNLYADLYIRNRVVSVTLTTSGGVSTLVTNSYDWYNYPVLGITDRPNLTLHDAAIGTSYGLRGNVTSTVTPGAARYFGYDIGGQTTTVSDGNGHSLGIVATGNTNYSAPDQLRPNDVDTLANSFTYSPAFGVTSTTGPNNNSVSQTFDQYGRVYSSTSADGMTTTYAYNYVNNTTTATTLGRAETSTYDGFGRTIKSEVAAGGLTVSVVDTEYAPCACSPLGKVKRVSAPHAPNEAQVWTVYTYDATGRTLTVTAPDGVSVTTYTYQGNRTTITDPQGKKKRYTRDAFGNLTQVSEDPDGINYLTIYTYDPQNRLTNVSMTRGSVTQTRSFVYDPSTGRLTQQTTPEAGTVQYFYNGDGSLDYRLDAKGQKVKYTYDSFGRTTGIGFYDASGAPAGCGVGFTWDTSDWQNRPYMDTNTVGRIAQAYYCGFTERYLYTSSGKVSAKQLVKGAGMQPPTLQARFEYGAYGNLSGFQPPWNIFSSAPSPYLAAYTLDGLGRQTALHTETIPPEPGPMIIENLVSNATYGAAGQMITMTSAGYSETRSYNTNLQLTGISAPGKLNLQYTYGSGAGTPTNGRLWKETDLMDGQETTYSYDALNRLTGASATAPSGWTESYNYDGFGNLYQLVRNGQNSLNVTIDGTTNRISSTGYGYDANGNLTSAPGATYTYDVSNRLTSNGAVYDASNQRVWDGQKMYFYGPGGELMGTYDVAADQMKHRYYFAGKLIKDGDDWVVTDRKGAVAVQGNTRVKHAPYGNGGSGAEHSAWKEDGDGLQYANQRYYSAGMGRFLTADPFRGETAAEPGSWNRYAFVGGDPINRVDPPGTYWALLFAGMCADPGDEVAYYCEEYQNQGPYQPQSAQRPKPPLNSEKGIRGVNSGLARLNSDCAKALGATSAEQAVDKLETVNFRDTALAYNMSFTATEDGVYSWKLTYTAGFVPPGSSDLIQLNNNPGLLDPTHVLIGTTPDGVQQYANLLPLMEQQYGLKAGSLNADLFWSIYVLHELGHVLGGLPTDLQGGTIQNTQKVVDNCFKDLKK